MATATITPNQDTVLAEIFIAAPPERIFEAITDPNQLAKWWGQSDLYRITERTSDLRPGGKWSSVGVGADGKSFRVDGEYLEVDPPRRWSTPGSQATWARSRPWSTGTFNRRPCTASIRAVRAKLALEPWSSSASAPQAAAGHGDGWKRVLGWLEAYVENGETVDTRT